MMKIILAATALALTVPAVPASAYDRSYANRGEYNRYSPDGRNPELERRRENYYLHLHSKQTWWLKHHHKGVMKHRRPKHY